MTKTQRIKIMYYGLFILSIALVLAGAWLRKSGGSTYGLPVAGMAIFLWLRFGEHQWPPKTDNK